MALISQQKEDPDLLNSMKLWSMLALKQAFLHSDICGLLNPEFIVRNLITISDYLYDPSTLFGDNQNKKVLV
jgi:hypothetical protein